MAQMLLKLDEHEDRVLTIIKGKYGLKNKNDAVKFVIDKFEVELLEPELRPEYAHKLQELEKTNKFKQYKSITELRRSLEDA